ncbi:MAG: hypothetical protein OXC18_00680 [Desulfurellaceae bacterium]|nr:hypothetical protein [Desulfurellaceae bacterium]
MITIISVLAGLSVLAAAYHPLVPVILQSERHGLLSDGVMLITMKKRDSSEMKTFPVDYLREGNMVYIGSDSDWWKHLEGGAEVTMLIQGAEVTGWAIPILDDPERSSAGFKKLRPWTYMRAEWTGAIFVEVEIQDQTQDNKSGP